MGLSQDALIGIFVAILAADIIVIVLALVWSRVQRRERSRPATGATSGSAGARPNGLSTNGGNGNGGYGINGGTSMNSGGRIVSVVPPIEPANDPTIDGLTGLLVPSAWSRMVADEDARIQRYHRSATVVIIELEGLDKLALRMGPGSIERIVPAVGRHDPPRRSRGRPRRAPGHRPVRGPDARDRRDRRDQLRRADPARVRALARGGGRGAPPRDGLGELGR